MYSAPYPGPERTKTRSGEANRTNLSAYSEFDDSQETSYTSGLNRGSPNSNVQFYEWSLRERSDFLKIYLFLCNIDQWTAGPFRKAIVTRLQALGKTAAERLKNSRSKASRATCPPLYRVWRPSSDALLTILDQRQTPNRGLSSASVSIGDLIKFVKREYRFTTFQTTETENISLQENKRKKEKRKSKTGGNENEPRNKN